MCISISKSDYTKESEYQITGLSTIINNNVIGGFDKVFNYFKMAFNPKSVIASCDLRFENGNEFLQMGFQKKGDTFIDFDYVDMNNPTLRINKLDFQFDDLNEKIDKIWDCGHQTFLWSCQSNLP